MYSTWHYVLHSKVHALKIDIHFAVLPTSASPPVVDESTVDSEVAVSSTVTTAISGQSQL